MNGERLKILMLEENIGFVHMIRKSLTQAGGNEVEVTHAQQLDEALDHLASKQYDAIVLDVSIPGNAGFETFSRIHVASPETPIVVLTTQDNLEFGLQAMRKGAQDYLVKGRVTAQLLLRSLRYAIERQQMLDTLRRLSLVDELTGLYNRRGFETLAAQHIKLSQRLGSSLALIALDLDGMTTINKKYGHEEGDLALVSTAEILRKTFRSSDIIARIGGDEFVILAIDVTPKSFRQIVTRLQENLAKAGKSEQKDHRLSAHTELIPIEPGDDLEIEELIARAEQILRMTRQPS